MHQDALFAIFGSLITLGLGINAYFIKSLVMGIDEVKATVAKVATDVAVGAAESKHLTARVTNTEADIREIRASVEKRAGAFHDLRNELGARIQVLEIRDKV